MPQPVRRRYTVCPLAPIKIVGGIFYGMFSPHDQQAVMSGLGDKFLTDLAWSIRGAREDLAELREWRPAWFPLLSGRCLANLIHDRIWARLVAAVDGNPHIETIDREPVREIWISQNYQIRIKRHHPDDKISTYPTAAALEFWAQGSQLPSLEAITLGAGYRWIAEERRVGPAVISYRDGKDHPIWAVELDEPDEGADAIGWRPITRPDLPTVDLFDATRIDEREEGSSS
ncbi:MAG: hypothetical protein M3Y48_03120 [Actinomycetota bacterium]|nr:hypothetical protein [Actinomycetota bacterium]